MDKAAFTEAVLHAEPMLYRVARTMLWDEAICADAAQQAILRAWECLPSLRKPQYFRTWLTRILINECTTLLRQQQRFAPYDPDKVEAIPAPVADNPSDRYSDPYSDLYAALCALDEKYRLPVVLHYWEGFKTREIADLLSVPEGTIKTRLKTARKQLCVTLEGACFA